MKRPLLVLAWINVVLHIAGMAFAAFGIRPDDLAVAPELSRAYLDGPPIGWTLGWVTWMLCAIALIAFLATVVNRLGEPATLARLGLTFAVVGLGFDLLCDSVFILVLPRLTGGFTQAALFTVLRVTSIASLLIANGSYSVAILLIALEMRRRRGVRLVTTYVGLGVAAFGVALAGAAFTYEPVHVMLATPPTMGLFCVWVVLVARDLEKPA